MEEIGTMDASCTFNEGYTILHLEVPVTIESPLGSAFAFDYEKNEIVYQDNGKSYSAHEVSIAAIDVDRQEYGFNLTKKPYEFFSIWGVDWAGDSTVGVSFWSWFKKHMIDSIEYL